MVFITKMTNNNELIVLVFLMYFVILLVFTLIMNNIIYILFFSPNGLSKNTINIILSIIALFLAIVCANM